MNAEPGSYKMEKSCAPRNSKRSIPDVGGDQLIEPPAQPSNPFSFQTRFVLHVG